MKIIGISAYYHDSSAAIIINGKAEFAVLEERITRIKHDNQFPINAIQACLKYTSLTIEEIDAIAFYEKPFWKFDRILSSIIKNAPNSFKYYLNAIPEWVTSKLWIESNIRKELKYEGKIYFVPHHDCHAYSAIHFSDFKDAAILSIDGVGEKSSTVLYNYVENRLQKCKEIEFPNSLGLLYSAFTIYCGFKANSGEYKLMGLAPYGTPKYIKKIYDHFITTFDDGSYKINYKKLTFLSETSQIIKSISNVFQKPQRVPETNIDQFYKDIAASIQQVIEEVVIHLLQKVKSELKSENLILTGGVALNCKLNQKIVESNIFENVYIYSNPGDGGSSIGAACIISNEIYKIPEIVSEEIYLGREYSDNEVEHILKKYSIEYSKIDQIENYVTEELTQNKIIGWFNGKAEFGPRALGNRSILANPQNAEMKTILNEKIKIREQFRPFAPIVLENKANNYFDLGNTNYHTMMVTVNAKEISKTVMPSVIHEDNTARVQLVSEINNKDMYRCLKKFYEKTNCPAFINTSFNLRGEPIVETIEDAIRTFVYSGIDILIFNAKFVIEKQANINLETQFQTPTLHAD